MPSAVEPRAQPWLRVAAVGLVAAGVAACSSDATRFNDNPFASPYAATTTPPAEVVGSVPTGQVAVQPLPPPPGTAVSATGATPDPYRPAQPRVSAAAAPAGWTTEGGTPITVQPGETIEHISRRYGVPAAAILAANGLRSGSLHQGQRLIVPRYSHAPGRAPTPITADRPSARPAKAAASGVHVVTQGETLSSIGRLYGKSRNEIAKANRLASDSQLRIGQRLIIPGVAPARIKTAAAAPSSPPPAKSGASPAPARDASRPAAPAEPARSQASPPQRLASTEPTAAAARIATPAADTPAEADTTGAAPSFRWPVRGRVIAGFGAKTGGQHNDGINVAVPEGTSIKAAEDGVVAYAGNELKGYGNLVLVRHANGYVTAYAHASEVLVKRGDQVKRGQIIAKAGQTGNVASPQLHFEIRKGSTPIDPMQYLASN